MDPSGSSSSIFGGAPSFGKKPMEKQLGETSKTTTNIFGSSSSRGGGSNPFIPSSKSIFGSDSSESKSSGFLFGKKLAGDEKEISSAGDNIFQKASSSLAEGKSAEAKKGNNPFLGGGDSTLFSGGGSFKNASRISSSSSSSSSNNLFAFNKAFKPTRKPPHMPSSTSFAPEKKTALESRQAVAPIPSLFQIPPPRFEDSLFKSEEPPPLFKSSKKNPFSFKSAPPQQPPLPQYSSSSSLACNSDQERYDTLSARNTQLRKANEGEPRESLIGDCPDMCPETERYRRAIQNQLRVYERRRDGSANHKAIVKEYSRSSADQEFPLSSELRPGRLLSQTMDHILCNIVDRIDVNRGSIHEWFDYLEAHGSSNGFQPCSETRDDIGEWFEFLWSATRAIRKDITQQRLVDLGAVDLVEKCARFHIVCSERLVQAESKDFSLKLNDENLTKCLQTLQHLYYDLDLEGVSCPNESEFRCYEILMNANSGEVLRKVSTLNNDVRSSGPVRFGLKIVYALHSNNYVRFFKLLREASLLQSCILLRYFNQVRSKAVQTFVKAFCSSKIETKFELSHLTNMLGFEDEIEASGFLLAHGITVEGVLVHINKSDFCFPEEAPIIRRPINRVECKKKSDWSLIINGGISLPPNPYISYVPQDSFSQDGRLVKEAEGGDFRQNNKLKEKALQEAQRKEARLNGLCSEIGHNIIEEVSLEESQRIAHEVILREGQILKESEGIYEHLLEECIQETAREGMKDSQNEELDRRIKKENENNASEELLNEYVDEFVSLFVFEFAGEEMDILQKDRRFKSLLSASELIVEEWIEDFVRKGTSEIASELIKDAESQRDRKMEALVHAREKKLLRTYFSTWKTLLAKEKKRKAILSNFPSAPSLFQNKETQNDKFSSSCGRIPPLTLSEVVNSMKITDRLFKYVDLEDEYFTKTLLEPLDFPSLIEPLMAFPLMKVVLSSGMLTDGSSDKLFFEIVKKKCAFKPAVSSSEEGLNNDEGLLCRYISQKGPIILIRSLTQDNLMREIFYDDMARKRYLNGTTGILFFLSSEESSEEASERMRVLLNNLPSSSKIPIVLLSLNNPSAESILRTLCARSPNISSFETLNFPSDPFDIQTPLLILNAMKHLTFNLSESQVSLQSETLRAHLDRLINDRFYKEIYFDLRSRSEHRDPRVIIEFYNSLIDYVKEEGSYRGTQYENISWPVPEVSSEVPLYWNDATYRDKLIEVLNQARLPMIGDPSECQDDWAQITALVLKYFNSMARSYSNTTPFLSEIRRILLKSYNVMKGPSRIQWANLIHTCIEYKLSLLDTSDPFDDSHRRELVVVRDSSSLRLFIPPCSWTKLDRRESSSSSLNASLSKTHEESKNDFSLLKDSSMTIQKELEASQVFERKLRDVLGEEEEDKEGSMAKEEAVDEENRSLSSEPAGNDEPIYEKEYVPMISYLSPSLGAAVSPIRVTKRLEVILTGMSPNFSPRRRVPEKRKIDKVVGSREEEERSSQFQPKKMSIDRMLERLQSQVSGNLNDSKSFEEKLLNATLQSDDS